MCSSDLLQCSPDDMPENTAMADFDIYFYEIPSEAVDVLVDMILATWHLSSRGKDLEASMTYERKAKEGLDELRRLYGGRQGQQADAPVLEQMIQGERDLRYFGFRRTRY